MKKYISEMIGTFLLVFIGCGSAVFLGTDPLLVALVFGLTVMLNASSLIGQTSGAHLNPAVTLAMLVNKKISTKDAVAYIVAQVIGGILGAFFLAFLVSQTTASGIGANGFGALSATNATMTGAFVGEMVITAIFVFLILSVADHKNAAFIIGLSLTALILVLFNITGASINPARSLGPALVAGGEALSQVWLFILAPSLGGLLGGLVYKSFK